MGLFGILMTDKARRLSQAHLVNFLATPDTTIGTWFAARVDQESGTQEGGGLIASEDAPRQGGDRVKLFWETGQTLIAGDRIEVQSAAYPGTYELARRPQPYRLLSGVELWEAEAISVASLFPRTATVEELGGADVRANVGVSIWQASGNRMTEVGAAYDYEGECSYEHWPVVDVASNPNRQLNLGGGEVYRIVGSTPHKQVPRVVMFLRRVRPGG